MTEKKEEHSTEKETRKAVTEDMEKFFRDVWGKVVEYASLGAEEATKLSTTAKTRVDIETLKFKRGKVVKMLGERYLELCEKDSSLVVKGTKEILSDIKAIDNEIKGLDKEIAKAKKAASKPAAKKAAPKKAPARKRTAAKKTTTAKTSDTKTTTPEVQDRPARTPEAEKSKE